MSKKITLVIIIALMATLTVQADITVTNTWSGIGGTHNATIIANNDAIQNVFAAGNVYSGIQTATVGTSNPYGYGVENTNFQVEASTAGGGYIELLTQRTDSYAPLYGPSGQTNYGYVYSSDGSAAVAYNTTTNYASMGNNQYSNPTTPGGVTFEAAGTSWMVNHSVNTNPFITDPTGFGNNQAAATNSGGYAAVTSFGDNGSGEIWIIGSSVSNTQGFNLGDLPVLGHNNAWDNNAATFEGTGQGTFNLYAQSNTGLHVHEGGIGDAGINVPGANASWSLTATYDGTFFLPDFGISN